MDVIAAPMAAASAPPPPGKVPAGAGDAFAAVLARAAQAGGEAPEAAPGSDATEAVPVLSVPAAAPPAPRLSPAATPGAAAPIADAGRSGPIVPALPAPGVPEGDTKQPPGMAGDVPLPGEAAAKDGDGTDGAATGMDVPPLPEAVAAAPPPATTPAGPATPPDAAATPQATVRRGAAPRGEAATAAPLPAPTAGDGQVARNLEAAGAAPPTTTVEAAARPASPRRSLSAPAAPDRHAAPPAEPAPAATLQPDASAAVQRLPTPVELPVARDRSTPPSHAPASAATGPDPAAAPVANTTLAAPAATDTGEPAPARHAVPSMPPARQIAPVIVAVAIGGGTARLAVTLEPAELGRVEISVERSGDNSQVQILAERPETLALLQRDQRELDRALSQAGVGTEGRSVSLGLATDGGAGQQAWQDRRDARPGPRRTADIAAPPAEPRRAVHSLLDFDV